YGQVWRLSNILHRGNRCLSALDLVPGRDDYVSKSDRQIRFADLERGGVFIAFWHSALARVRSCLSVPPSRRTGRHHHVVAIGGCGFRESAAAPRRRALEHRRRTAGEFGPHSHYVSSLVGFL